MGSALGKHDNAEWTADAQVGPNPGRQVDGNPRIDETELQALERFVAENEELLALEERIGRLNIFDVLGIARNEIRHSNFLAWLLTPGESHGLGDLFLKVLLMDLLRKARQQRAIPPISPVKLDGADLRGVEVRREWKNIDLLISCTEPPFVIAVENKIDSGEHGNQLQRYKDTIDKEFPGIGSLNVFLTTEGDEASDDDWVSYSYSDIYQALSRTRRANATAIGGHVAVFLDHYLALIGNQFMENDELDTLCRKIYSNHHQALDLIWRRVGTPTSGLLGRARQWIEGRPDQWHFIASKQREVEFIPAAWRNMLPPVGKRRIPEHWMTVRLHAGDSRLRLLVVVCPTTDAALRRRVIERLVNEESEFGFSPFFKKKGLTEAWTRVLSEDVCELPEEEEVDIDAVMPRIEKRLGAFLTQTAGIPAAIASLSPV